MSTSAAGFPFWFGRTRGRDTAPQATATAAWDDVPDGPVPAEVLRYFEEAIAREEERALRRARRDGEPAAA